MRARRLAGLILMSCAAGCGSGPLGSGDQFFTSQATAVSAVWSVFGDPAYTVLAFAPDGSSQTLGVTYAKQVVFLDLDGICSFSF